MKPDQFIKLIATEATELQKDGGVFASVTIAQAALETGWGESMPPESNNLFGIKWWRKTDGDFVVTSTKEFINGKWITKKAKLKKYESMSMSLKDHAKFLLIKRYKNVLTAKDGLEAAIELEKAGYATDPNYAENLIAIIKQYKLLNFDKVPGKSDEGVKVILNGKVIPALSRKQSDVVEIQVAGSWHKVADIASALGISKSWDEKTNTVNLQV